MSRYLETRLGLTVPVIQAPMAGVSTPALAAAVSNAGALGSIAVGAMSADAADAALAEAGRHTAGALNVNVFVHDPPRRNPAREAAWLERLRPCFEAFDAVPPARLEEIYPTLDEAPALLEVLVAHRPAVISLHFGLPQPRTLRALAATGAMLIGNATSVAEARRLEAAGLHLIIAQGFEAGGHRGSFDGPDDELPTLALLPGIAAAVEVPVVAAGGLRTGSDIAAALSTGAVGAQLGTVFVECPESAAAEPYRQALRAPDLETAMTAVFSGRRARGIVNDFVRELAAHEAEVPDYPVAYDAGKRLAAAAAARGSAAFTAMWAGQGPRRPAPQPAAELVQALAREIESA